MTFMDKLSVRLPELVLLAVAVVWAVGLTSDLVAAFAVTAIVVSAGFAAEELIYRYSRRQGRHGRYPT